MRLILEKPLCFFDLETTGFKTNKVAVDIVEIAAIKFSKNALKEKWNSVYLPPISDQLVLKQLMHGV